MRTISPGAIRMCRFPKLLKTLFGSGQGLSRDRTFRFEGTGLNCD